MKPHSLEQTIKFTSDSNFPGCKLWIAPAWDCPALRTFLQKLIENNLPDSTEKKIIYQHRNQLTRFSESNFTFLAKSILVKDFLLRRSYDRLRFRFLESKAIRSLKTALLLKKLNIKTPEPVAVIEKRGFLNKLECSCYITEYLDYDFRLKNIVKEESHPHRSKVKTFLPKIASDISKMHSAGLIHNDMHAGNILIKYNAGEPHIYYIDLNRAHIKKNISFRNRIKDMIRMKLTDEERTIFMKSYDNQNFGLLLERVVKLRNRRRTFVRMKKRIRAFFKKKHKMQNGIMPK